MKKLLALLIILPLHASASPVIKETLKTITSPDGAYAFSFYQKQLSAETRQMYYTLTFNGKEIIRESELGVLIENKLFESALGIPNDDRKLWGESLRLTGEERKTENTMWKPVYGERAEVKDHYNELILSFQKGESEGDIQHGYDKRRLYFMSLVVRAYDEGIAFRYHFPEATNGLFLHIVGEQTQFAFNEGTQAWYERWAQGPYQLLPLSNWTDECERPLTLKLENGLTVALGEAEMIDYARMKFRLDEKKTNTLQVSLYSSVDVITPYSTPWRVIMAAEKPGDLIMNNDLFLNLNPPCAIADASWIKPGKVMRANLKQEEVKACIDFASQMGMQYVHLDAGWYGPEMKMTSDATSVATDKNLNMPALCAYAESKGVGLWVYVNQRALVQQLDELLPIYKEWGLKGVKFGFVQIGNQHWSTWLHDAVRKCAQYQLMVDIHDEYRPTGFSRTYPNLMTQEGIRGNEEMPDATHNVTLPFTRYLCGAGDYTLCYYSRRKKTTYAHQLAMAAVYYSPIQFMFWYDTPSQYGGEPELDFWKNIPTVWDETLVLDGAIGEYIATARRSGNEWFVGVMTNNDPRKLTLTTDFLKPGKKYEVVIYEDDDSIKTRTKVRVTKKNVKAGDKLTFNLKGSGGVAMRILGLVATPANTKQLEVYPAPQGAALNADFTVKVRQPGYAWQDTPAYLVKVDEVRDTKHHVENASMSYFDFTGEVEVSVIYNKGAIETARVRPLSLGIIPQVKGDRLTFTLNKPCNLSVEVNDDIFHNLHLFANPVDTYRPTKKDKNLIYFAPGIHHFDDNIFRVPSDKTVYVAGGAILMGQLLLENVENVNVLGRGMVDHTVKHGIRIANCRNILIEGLFATQCSTGGSDNVTIRNVKSISYYGWGDGMNVFASNNVLHDGVFCRNSDDCTTVYGTRLGFKGGCKNITMRNSTLWADVAHPIFIGIHGDTQNPEILEDLNYINIDILDHKEKQVDYQGCLAINAGDNNLIRNVRFENIRIENFRQGQLINLRIFYNPKYCTAPGRGIENVLFKNISYTGDRAELSIIAGYNEERNIKNIRFENLQINGEVISDDMVGKPAWYKTGDMARFFIGEHVEGVQFVK